MASSRSSSADDSRGKGDCYEAVPAVGSSANVLLLFQLQDLRLQAWVNLILSICCLMFIGVNIALIVLNSDNDYRDSISQLFHNVEFWSTFAFSIVEVGALLFSPHCSRGIHHSPILLKLLVAIGVIITFFPAILMSVDDDRYDFACHNTEYVATMVMSFTDVILMLMLITGPSKVLKRNIVFLALSILGVLAGMVQLVVFNTTDQPAAEQVPHFMEFVINIINASVMFSFTTDSRLLINSWTQTLLQVPAKGVVSSPTSDGGNAVYPSEAEAQAVGAMDHAAFNSMVGPYY